MSLHFTLNQWSFTSPLKPCKQLTNPQLCNNTGSIVLYCNEVLMPDLYYEHGFLVLPLWVLWWHSAAGLWQILLWCLHFDSSAHWQTVAAQWLYLTWSPLGWPNVTLKETHKMNRYKLSTQCFRLLKQRHIKNNRKYKSNTMRSMIRLSCAQQVSVVVSWRSC